MDAEFKKVIVQGCDALRIEIPEVLVDRMVAEASGRASSSYLEWLWRSRCEWIGWRKVMADCVFQTAATVMIWFQTAKRLVISVCHSSALIR